MRKTIAILLLASAISTPAIAKEHGRGHHEARAERGHKAEKRVDRSRARIERRADRADARSMRRAKVVRAADRRAGRAEARAIQRRAKAVRVDRRAERQAIERRADRRAAERRIERRAAARADERRAEARFPKRLRDRRAIERRAAARAEAREDRKAWQRATRDRQRALAQARHIRNERIRYQPVRVVEVVREAPRYVEVRRPVYRVYQDDYRRYPAYERYADYPSYGYAQAPYYPAYAPSGGGLLGGGLGDIASVLLPVALSQFGLGDTLGLGGLSSFGGGYGLTDLGYAYDSGYGYPAYYEPGYASYGYDNGIGGGSSDLLQLAALALGSGYLGGDMLGLGSALGPDLLPLV